MRNRSDYDLDVNITVSEAKKQIQVARQFINFWKTYQGN
jgi:hypothetical protein